MSHVIHAEITVELDDLAGYRPEQFIDGLERNLNNAMEIEEYSMSVTYNADSRADALAAYYADAIDSGKIRLEDIPRLLAANGLKPVSDFLGDLPVAACS